MSKINDSGGGQKPVNDPVAFAPTLDIFEPQGFAEADAQCIDPNISAQEIGVQPFNRAFNDHYHNGLTNVMKMYDNLRAYYSAEDVTFMNIDHSWEGTIELTSSKESPIGTVKVITVNGTGLGLSDVTPKGSDGRFLAVHWGPDAELYHPVDRPGTYPLLLSDGGQLIVDWQLDEAGKPASEVKVTYRPAHLAQWPEAPRISAVEGKAVFYNEHGKQCVSPGQRIDLPKGDIFETKVSVFGDEWMIVSKDGKVAFEKESGLPKIYFDGPMDYEGRMSVKPRPLNPFIVTPEGELYLAANDVGKLLSDERFKVGAESIPADQGMPRLSNPDEFIGVPKADSDPFSKGKKGGGPAFFKQGAQEFAKQNVCIAEAIPVVERSPGSRGAIALLKSLKDFHGQGQVGFLNLLDSPAEIHLTSNAEYPVGTGNVVMIGNDSYAISEMTRDGQRVIDIYTESNTKKPITIDKPGEHIYALRDGGLLRLDWTEVANPDEEPKGKVKASYISREGINPFIEGLAAEGKGFCKIGDSLHSIEVGEKVPIPAKGMSEVYVLYKEKSWKINGLNGKVDVSPFESSKGMHQIYYDIRYDSSSFGTPRTDHPLHITPEGDAYLVYDRTGIENQLMADPKIAAEGTKGSLHMGELISNGTFNVLGGAIVVCGVEAIDAFYEDATGEQLPESAEGVIHPVVGVGTFYGLAAWMESASSASAVDWIAFNSNFARATPGALAVGAPIFYGSGQLVSEAGVDPMSFEGQLATTTIGGAGLALTLNATLPGFLTVGGYTTGASLMSAGAIAELGVLGTSTILLGEGVLVAGAGVAGYSFGTYVVDPVAGEIVYNFSEETPYSDGTLSGWAAEDEWHMAALGGTVLLGPAIGAYILIGEKVVENYKDSPEGEGEILASKPDPLYNPDGPFTTFM